VLNSRSMIGTITVNVGAEELKFPVLEVVIRKSSTFFDNAMKPEWASSRAEPRLVDLTDQDPEIFKIYLHWLYFKNVPTVITENFASSNPEFVTLAKCYILGEMLMDIGFKNAVLDALFDAIKYQPYYKARYPGPKSTRIIYSGTVEGPPARHLLVDMWVTEATKDWAEFMTNNMLTAFTHDLAKALLGMRSQDTTASRRA
jgi:hypothetical protein